MSEFLPISQVPPKDSQLGAKIEKLKESASMLRGRKADDKKLMETARAFESLLTFTMLKNMRQTLPKSDFLKSSAQDIYQSMLDQEITKSAAKNKSIGIADMIYRQFSKNGTKIETTNNENQRPSDSKKPGR